ncbi:four helix bundle protein [Runella aurantiaca]|uniref:Four helix bundle protein n=1 Tax=Runella aurantiaca TaxID=2282308 RepID=A0A369I5V0_9BACT|nr:four helix bundle protein [Runella aurantiaca]RDB04958.1 four helix bundle protein [Runella aurantiaca]
MAKSDFSAKMSIAYKECLETKYWLSLLKDTGYIEQKAFESIYNDADELAKILFSILINHPNKPYQNVFDVVLVKLLNDKCLLINEKSFNHRRSRISGVTPFRPFY